MVLRPDILYPGLGYKSLTIWVCNTNTPITFALGCDSQAWVILTVSIDGSIGAIVRQRRECAVDSMFNGKIAISRAD